MNAIKDCPITIEDITIAEKVFGKDINSLKGKTTRSKSVPVVHDVIEIPPEIMQQHGNVELCADVVYIQGLTFNNHIKENML